MSHKKLIYACLAATCLTLSSPQHTAEAADLPGTVQYQATTESGLSFTVVPFYMWLPGMDGRVGVFGTTADVDITPIDLIKNVGDLLKALGRMYMDSP